MPDWIQIVLGICTPVIAGYSVYIGRQQWKLGAYKLKHDLFEKRWNVYVATNDAIVCCINGSDEAQRETYQEFKRKRMDAKFLFPKELNDYLEKINSVISELQAAIRNLQSESLRADSPERSEAEKQVSDQTEWLRSQIEAIVPMFHEHLDLSRTMEEL